MAVDKLVDSAQLDADLTSVADAIRTRSGESGSLSFPNGFVAAVNSIEGITNVQINGTSIVDNGVANIPQATASTLGVARTNLAYGTGITDDGRLYINSADSTAIKESTGNYKPIVPGKQDESVFYGLAKAAGDSTQAASANNVGVFTDDAKVAIQKMLGIYEPPYDLIDEITLDSETRFEITTDSNGTPLNLRNVFIYVFYPANSANASTGYGRYEFHDANNVYVNAETGKYATSTANQFKHLLVERKGNLTFANWSSRTSTGSSSTWCVKNYNNGIKHNMGNIVKIRLNLSDVEPAGTIIKIWGQWAY